MIDSIGQYGIAVGVLLLFAWFLKGLLTVGGRALGKLVEKHLETMDTFSANQTRMAQTLDKIGERLDLDAVQAAERHATVVAGLGRSS